MLKSEVIARDGDLIFAEVDGEAVALSAARGLCYGLDGIGLRVLQLIETPSTFGNICDRLVLEYDVDRATCEQDVSDLIGSLAAEGLVNVRQDGQTR